MVSPKWAEACNDENYSLIILLQEEVHLCNLQLRGKPHFVRVLQDLTTPPGGGRIAINLVVYVFVITLLVTPQIYIFGLLRLKNMAV